MRKPSLAAWVSNLLVRSSPGEVEPLLRLGEGLRQAHQDLDGTQLRELSRRQHALIRALSLQARQLAKEAGHPIGESVQREVENTLRAVLADPEAAEAWAGGRLAKPLSAAVGFPSAAEGARPQRPARCHNLEHSPARAAPRNANRQDRYLRFLIPIGHAGENRPLSAAGRPVDSSSDPVVKRMLRRHRGAVVQAMRSDRVGE